MDCASDLFLFLLYESVVIRRDYESKRFHISFLDAGSIPAISTIEFGKTAVLVTGAFYDVCVADCGREPPKDGFVRERSDRLAERLLAIV